MDRQNWYPGQLVDVPEMDLLGTTADNAINNLTLMLGNTGIVSGLGVLATAPPSLLLQVPAGTVALGDGTVVATTGTRNFDATPFVPGGGSVTLYLYAFPLQNSDTPTIVSDGSSINYRLFDDFQLSGQLTNVGGFATLGVLLCSCVLTTGQTTIPQSDISTAAVVFWTTISQLKATLATYATHLSTLDGEISTIDGTLTTLQNEINRLMNVGVPGFNANMVLDASVVSSWDFTLSGNVTSMTINNAFVGQRLLFIIAQDGSGGHTLNWAGNMRNTAPINGGANSVNIVEFVRRGDGFFYPITDISVYNAA